MKRPLLIVGALLALVGIAAGGTVIAVSVYGVRLIPQAAVPPNCADVSGKLCLWAKSADNHLYFHNVAGSDVDISNPGTGTVSSVATGNGLTGGPITTTGTVSLALQPVASMVDWAKAKGCSGSLGSNFNTGVNFFPTAAMTGTGVRFWLPSGANTSVTASLWDITAGGGALTTQSATSTAGAINTITFGASAAIAANGHEYAVTVFNGVDQIAYCPGNPVNSEGTRPQSFGVYYAAGGFCAGSNCAINQGQTNYAGVELVYTVP